MRGARLPGGEPAALAAEALAALRACEAPRGTTKIGGRPFVWGSRTYVMGIVNVTPDSFSGDGFGGDVDGAVAQAERLVAEGADIIDVGGESTRPGSERISAAEELARVLPVVQRLARTLPVPVSIDTYKAAVAERCLDAGAALVNDIWGLRADPAMAALIARRRVPVALMHNQRGIAYADLLGDVIRMLRESIALGRRAGIAEERMIVDPGIGFGKSKEQNLELLHRLGELKVLGRPLLLGTSRKSTIGFVLNLPPEERVEGTGATVALGVAQGVDMVRVHDVREMVRICRMADAVVRWQPGANGEQHWPGQTG
jgi:dihydropteroate synthase